MFAVALLAVAGLAAQDSLTRQLAAVSRQREAVKPPVSLQRQQASVARQHALAGTSYVMEPPAGAVSDAIPWATRAAGPACTSLEEEEARDYFRLEEQRDGLPAGLLEAVARQESALHPCAVSRAGAMGLMQLMPATALQLGVDNPFDPWQSLQGGGQFLRLLLDRYGGDLPLALGAYNAGPSRVDSYGAIPPIPETQNYVDSVLTRMRRITASDSLPRP